MTALSDADLVRAAREGGADGADAFGELVRRHQSAALALACSLVNDAAEAEDLVQEAFIRASGNLDMLADPGKFGPWFRRVVFGTCVDWLRAFRPELYRGEGAGEPAELAAPDPNPAERLERVELIGRVHRAVAELPPRYRVPLTMYHLDGVSQRKVAQALGVEESTVRSLLTRARRRLARILGAWGKEMYPVGDRVDEVLEVQGRPARLLHVLNGDATRWKLERSGVPGTLAVWADVLHEGPVPGDEVPPEAWRETRARYHGTQGGVPHDEALATMRRWDQALERFPEYDEVVIWCEHDLFDQLLLIRHLAWFARRDRGSTRLSLICIGEYPGVEWFKGLGQLSPDQLASLLDTRESLSRLQLELGLAAWRAFASADPTRIERFLERGSSVLPFLAPALRRLLQEYPWTRDGLSRTERRVLEVLASGASTFGELFPRMHDGEVAFYVADASLWTVLRALAGDPSAAVSLDAGEAGEGSLAKARVALTELGAALLAGGKDWVRTHGIDRWVGGVHLQGAEAIWRWDDATQRLTRL